MVFFEILLLGNHGIGHTIPGTPNLPDNNSEGLTKFYFQTVFCVIYVTIVYFMTSQPPDASRFGMFLAACLLVSFVAQSVGLVVGAAMNVQVRKISTEIKTRNSGNDRDVWITMLQDTCSGVIICSFQVFIRVVTKCFQTKGSKDKQRRL